MRTGGRGFFASGDAPGGTALIRRFVLVLLMAGLLVTSPRAWAQIALEQVTSCGQQNAGQTFPSTCTIPATGSGHLIVVAWKSIGGTGTGTVISSVTDNVGNSYGEAGAAKSTDSTHDAILDIWYAQNSIAGATSLTITPNPTGIMGGAVIWELSGVDTISPLDATVVLNNQAATSTPLGAAITTSSASEVIISAVNSNNAITGISSGNAFTGDSIIVWGGWAHLLTTSAGSYGAEWNESSPGTYSSSTVSFKAAGSYSACDLNQDGTVNILDVELATDMALAPANCTAPYGQCNLGFAQAVLNNAMGAGCVLPVLDVAPLSISFGNVTVGGSSTQTLTLTGSGTASSTISQATVSGTGFSINGLSLPRTLALNQTATVNVTFAPATAGSVNGSVAFTSSALDSPLSVSLSGNGVASTSHSVSLSWTPSTSTNVGSYIIYRITSSSPTAPPTPYPSLGSVLATTCSLTLCTYTDTTVQAGQGYWYYAAADGAGGTLSVPSNIVPAVIPTP